MTNYGNLAFQGLSGDECTMCAAFKHTANPPALYLLPCGDIICQNCLTVSWLNKPPTKVTVTCHLCREEAALVAPVPVETIRADRDKLEEAGSLRNIPHIATNPIVVVNSEGQYLLREIYSAVEDQMLSSEVLGGFPSHLTAGMECCLSDLPSNPILGAVNQYFEANCSRPKPIISPIDLETELLRVVDEQMVEHVISWHELPLLQNRAYFEARNAGDRKNMLKVAKEEIKSVREMAAVWMELVGALVGMLTARHLSRFTAEDEVISQSEKME